MEGDMIDINKLRSAVGIKVSYRNPYYTALDFKVFVRENNMTTTRFANLMGVKVKKVDKWLAGKKKMTLTESILFSLFVENSELINKVIKVEMINSEE